MDDARKMPLSRPAAAMPLVRRANGRDLIASRSLPAAPLALDPAARRELHLKGMSA
jgi:hypothetical protein